MRSYYVKVIKFGQKNSIGKVMPKGDSVKEVLNLHVSLIEMVVITLLVAFDIAIWDQLCS